MSCCSKDKEASTSPDNPAEPTKVFGGCGCFSPDCFRLTDGNYELRDSRGQIFVLTPREIHDLHRMLNGDPYAGFVERLGLPDGNFELRNARGQVFVLNPREIHDLKGMLNEAYNTGLIERPS